MLVLGRGKQPHRIHVWYIYLHEWLIFINIPGRQDSPSLLTWIQVASDFVHRDFTDRTFFQVTWEVRSLG